MTLLTALPLVAFAVLIGGALVIASGARPLEGRSWMVPAALGLAYLLFSLAAVVTEGPVGFWDEVSRSLWGNQLILDIMLAVGVAWAFIVPEAKALGMRPLPWLLGILCTGSIVLLLMVARLLYLREARQTAMDAPPRGVRPASALS